MKKNKPRKAARTSWVSFDALKATWKKTHSLEALFQQSVLR